MCILYINNINDIGSVLSYEAKQRGIEAETINFLYGKGFNYRSRWKVINIFEFVDYVLKNKTWDYDIYHFNYPVSTFVPKHTDVGILRKLGKKVFLQYHGSDIRGKKEAIKKVDGKFITTPELLLEVPDAEWIPLPYNIRNMKKRDNWNDTLKIIHAPSDRNIKGTTHILRAIKEIKKKYKINFKLIENKPNRYVLEQINNTDIVIDSIFRYPAWHGRVTIEAMYSGATSCFNLDPKLLSNVTINPFTSITKENIVSQLSKLIEEEGLRKELRIKGYRYIKKYHDSRKIFERLLKKYRGE